VDDRPTWFAPKRYGFGAGLPISWHGWLVLGVYIAILVAAAVLFDGKRLAQGAIIIPATIILVIIFARTTRGGRRWRWGEKD